MTQRDSIDYGAYESSDYRERSQTWPVRDDGGESEENVVVLPGSRPVAVIHFVETDRDILDRYVVRTTRRLDPGESLSDELLVAEMAALDPTLGFVRMGTRAWVWDANRRTVNP